MREPWAGTGKVGATPQCLQARLEGEGSESDEHPAGGVKVEFSFEVLPAVLELHGQGPVVGRRAAARRRQECAGKVQPVAGPQRVGLIRESHGMQRPEEEVARLVPGEHPAGAVSPVRRGREPDDEQGRLRISERRQGTGPIDLTQEAAGRGAGGLLAPGDQARATAASDDLALDAVKLRDPIRANTSP